MKDDEIQKIYESFPDVMRLADSIHNHGMMPPPTCVGCIQIAINKTRKYSQALDGLCAASEWKEAWQIVCEERDLLKSQMSKPRVCDQIEINELKARLQKWESVSSALEKSMKEGGRLIYTHDESCSFGNCNCWVQRRKDAIKDYYSLAGIEHTE